MANPLKSDKSTSLGLLLARLPIGVLFLLQGYNKIKNIGVTQFVADHITMVPKYMPPWFPKAYLTAVPIAELTFGAFVILGLLTRVAGFFVSAMLISFVIATREYNDPRWIEHPNFIFLGATLLLFFAGPGQDQPRQLALWRQARQGQMGLSDELRQNHSRTLLKPMGYAPWAFFLLIALSGCGAHITPPPHPADPVTVFVTDYGRHSTLLLPDDRGRWVEYTWGDWDWLGLNDRKWYKVLTPLFFSRASAFGRKWIETNPAAAPPDSGSWLRLISIPVSRTDAETLRRNLDDRYLREADTTVYSAIDRCCYAREEKHYWLFYNCNDQTADWLRSLGCRVEGMTMTSKFKLDLKTEQ